MLLVLLLIGTFFLEGPNPDVVGYQALGSHNCQPVHGATLTRALVFTHLADPDENLGVASVTACQFHPDDPLPKLPTNGYWFTGISTCVPTVAAFIAQWVFGPQQSMVDGGCDDSGPVLGDEVARAFPLRPRHLKIGICHVVNHVIKHCDWD